MSHPYEALPPHAFWRAAVADRDMSDIADLWVPKIRISKGDTLATAGSCFAQHLSRAMVQAKFCWLEAEPAPPQLSTALARSYGYGVFSFRTGNIYTASMLRQWVEAAFDLKPLDAELWEREGRIYDPLRPAIEVNGFATVAECLALREQSLAAIRKVLSEVDLFVFTLGLTESWKNRVTGLTYAACPGTLAGTFLPEDHVFHNQTYPEVKADLEATFDCIRQHNPSVKFLLTVSPVPLVASASGQHVLPSTVYSKSVLRAVAGDLCAQAEDLDYFPSYEIITSHPFRGRFFRPNQREVAGAGVDFVMRHFFAGIGGGDAPSDRRTDLGPVPASPTDEPDDDIQCEEALLEAFSK